MKNNELHNKKTGFQTPKAYFDTFEDRLFDRIKTEAVIPKETGFTTPDAYFDSLEDKLSSELFTANQETKVIPLQRKRNYIQYISYAAAACIVFFIALNFINTPEHPLTITDVASSDINTFIENDLIALNDFELINVYEEENIDLNTIFDVNLSDTETIDYLENSGDPYELLIEQ
ncbi:hypothetical protein KORDIASMS9_04087 [Kordia sp. SMS9]|uniref:hypothetical protein n=1 Tax=Kordia sp. SMS9 TaxID=2282170 RepID=UPI000E0D417A|nr:hypothetical protein [Kordia sp. SMS9]AXG71829.1 hypothetical protein KORDIASMS9_04087 [Kordia sp. SMS9]